MQIGWCGPLDVAIATRVSYTFQTFVYPEDVIQSIGRSMLADEISAMTKNPPRFKRSHFIC